MCDPHTVVAGAPPFGSPAIYRVPLKLLMIFCVAGVMAVVGARLPRVWSIFVTFRIIIFIGASIAAIALSTLHYRHRI